MNEQVGKITWSPDYESDDKEIIKRRLEKIFNDTVIITSAGMKIEKLLDTAFDFITRDWVAGDEGYEGAREVVRREFKKILGIS